MAGDQRYCLNCGVRGSEARLPFLEVLRARSEAPVTASTHAAVSAPVVPAVALRERFRVDAGLVAGVGVLLLAMLVGVLIGTNAADEPVQAAAPQPAQVIQVGGGGSATGVTGATQAEEVVETAAAKPTKKRSSSTSTKASETDDAKAPVKATNNAVKQLDTLTGAAREKAVEKLGKNIATGGKAPKKDSKPAAGGGDFEEIG